MTDQTHIPLPLYNRSEREHLYKWIIGEEEYVEGKFTEERERHDSTLSEHFDIDEFWYRQVTQYYDRARMFLQQAQVFRLTSIPEDHERAERLEKMALQAVAKAMMTAKGFSESMIRVFGEMPKPGVSSGVIEPWHPICPVCGEPITPEQTFRYKAGSDERYHFDHFPEDGE